MLEYFSVCLLFSILNKFYIYLFCLFLNPWINPRGTGSPSYHYYLGLVIMKLFETIHLSLKSFLLMQNKLKNCYRLSLQKEFWKMQNLCTNYITVKSAHGKSFSEKSRIYLNLNLKLRIYLNLNVQELLARNRRDIWVLSDNNGLPSRHHLVWNWKLKGAKQLSLNSYPLISLIT